MDRNRNGLIGTGLVFLALCGFAGAPDRGRAEDSKPTEQAAPVEPAPEGAELIVSGRPGPKNTGLGGSAAGRPGLDSLLHLPSGYLGNGGSRPVAGASEAEWRRRFRKAEQELAAAERGLASTRLELDGVAEEGGANQWAVAPPGSSSSGSSASPLSFKLRQALVRDRERVEASEKALRDLRIEADLAGVPADWRSESGAVERIATPSSGISGLP